MEFLIWFNFLAKFITISRDFERSKSLQGTESPVAISYKNERKTCAAGYRLI